MDGLESAGSETGTVQIVDKVTVSSKRSSLQGVFSLRLTTALMLESLRDKNKPLGYCVCPGTQLSTTMSTSSHAVTPERRPTREHSTEAKFSPSSVADVELFHRTSDVKEPSASVKLGRKEEVGDCLSCIMEVSPGSTSVDLQSHVSLSMLICQHRWGDVQQRLQTHAAQQCGS
jgi:hypothetical protein